MRALGLIALFFTIFAANPGSVRDVRVAADASNTQFQQALPQDAVCGEDIRDVTCQWVIGTTETLLPSRLALAASPFSTQPIRATGQDFAPDPPHPRHLS